MDDGAGTGNGPGSRGQNRLFRWLEERLFPAVISYTIHPLHIVALLLLWILLLVVHAQVFELVGGNYTNGLSAMAASIVLLQQTRQQHDARRRHREHGELLRRLHDRLEQLERVDHRPAAGGGPPPHAAGVTAPPPDGA
jgi:hypothetical protein